MRSTPKECLELSLSSLVVSAWFPLEVASQSEGGDKARVLGVGLIKSTRYTWGHQCILQGCLWQSKY